MTENGKKLTLDLYRHVRAHIRAGLSATACATAILCVFPGTVLAEGVDRQVITNPPSQVDSIFGAYMAAQHAEQISDYAKAADLLDRLMTERPDDQMLQRRGMLANLHAGRVPRAVTLARSETAIYPPEVSIATLTIAADLMLQQDWERVVKTLEPARRIALARFATPVMVAWAEQGRGNTDAAIEALATLREQNDLPDLHDFHAGMIFMAAGRVDAAEALLSSHADDITKAPLGIVRLIARVQVAQGNQIGASDVLQQYNARNPGITLLEDDIAALNTSGTLAPLVSGPLEAVSDAFIDLSLRVRNQAPMIGLRYARLGVYLDSENDLGRMIVAAVLEDRARYEAAIDTLEQIAPKSTYSWDARMDIAGNLMRMNQDDAAIERLEAMAEERPDDIVALQRLGYLMRARERFEEGTEYYNRVLDRIDTITPNHWSIFYHRGITLERTGRWPEAEADLKKALELRQDEPEVLNYLGYSWVDQNINVEEGLEMIRKAVAQQRNSGFIVDSLGWAYYRLGNYDEAVVHLERAVQLRPGNAIINDHLGDAYWKVGRRLEATYHWHHALTQEPDDALREAIEKKLEIGLDAYEASIADQ